MLIDELCNSEKQDVTTSN